MLIVVRGTARRAADRRIAEAGLAILHMARETAQEARVARDRDRDVIPAGALLEIHGKSDDVTGLQPMVVAVAIAVMAGHGHILPRAAAVGNGERDRGIIPLPLIPVPVIVAHADIEVGPARDGAAMEL